MILLTLWLTIGGIRVFVLLLQLFRIQRLKRCSFPPSTELNELFQRLASRLAVNRRVELRVSPTHRSSFLLGFLHPVILLPAEERMEPGEAELVLRHELAHVRRRDDWANLIQQFILAIFFFHPAVWWISKQLSLEREIACDDHVLQQSRRPQAYALLLANLAARMQRGLPLLAPGSSNNKTQLKQRIDMILNPHRNTSPRLAKTWLAVITSAAALLAVAIICSAPRIVLAQNETAPAAANTPSADALAGGIASVAFAPDAPDSDSADTVSRTTPAPAAVGPGPKFKPGSPSALVRPAVIAVPAAPSTAAHVVAVAPVPPTPFLAAIEPGPEPQAPRSPRPVRAPRPGNKDSSLEERLERLERMVESLLKQQSFHLKSANDGMIDRKEIAKIEAFAKRQAEVSRKQMIDPKEIEKIKELAEREAGRATEQAKRATMEAEKALKAERKLHTARKVKDGSQKQLEALRKQLEILEREREKLDRQIEQLEQDQEQLDEQRDEDQAGSDTQSQPPAPR
jgi:beta-lactamase regulating signal transducer with metallopeptidase domain